MHHIRYLVDEPHDLLLEHLGHLIESADVAEAENGNVFRSSNKRIEICSRSFQLDIRADDLGSCLAEAQPEQRPNLDERVFEEKRFVRVLGRLLSLFHGQHSSRVGVSRAEGHRVLGDYLDSLHHPVERVKNQHSGIFVEVVGSASQEEAHHQSPHNV